MIHGKRIIWGRILIYKGGMWGMLADESKKVQNEKGI
jgi:hypothetical protein